jgi:hypothetical protein
MSFPIDLLDDRNPVHQPIIKELREHPEQSFGESVHRVLVKANRDEQGFVRRLVLKLGFPRHRFIREFCVVDAGRHEEQVGAPCIVFFVPDGYCKPFKTSYEKTVSLFEETDRRDGEFWEYICGIA